MLRLTCGVLLVLLIAIPSLAQQPTPPLIPYGMSISTENAKKIAAAAIAEAQKIKCTEAIAIVDTGGYLLYFERMPDTQTGSIELAIEKARTSVLFRRPTKALEDMVAQGGLGLRVLRFTNAIPVEGGFPIIYDGKLIGAIGLSGGSGEQDGQVAKAAVSIIK